MSPTSFRLHPFEPTARTQALAIEGTVERSQGVLAVTYKLTGDLTQVAVPPPDDGFVRRDRLWEHTCFEFFLAAGTEGRAKAASAPYWEFNLSPGGNWNVFSLAGYRQGLKEEQAIAALPFVVFAAAGELRLDISVDASALVAPNRPALLGASAVIKLMDGTETFWAIAHPGPEADFHHPDSFVLALP